MSRFATLLRQMIFVAALVLSCVAIGQQPYNAGPVQPPPIPPALRNAKSFFLSNAGGDSGLFPQPFTGDPNRGYAELYARLKSAGYKLVDDPAKADVVLELQLTAPDGPSSANKQNGASDPLPMFRLVMSDLDPLRALGAYRVNRPGLFAEDARPQFRSCSRPASHAF